MVDYLNYKHKIVGLISIYWCLDTSWHFGFAFHLLTCVFPFTFALIGILPNWVIRHRMHILLSRTTSSDENVLFYFSFPDLALFYIMLPLENTLQNNGTRQYILDLLFTKTNEGIFSLRTRHDWFCTITWIIFLSTFACFALLAFLHFVLHIQLWGGNRFTCDTYVA